MNERLFTLGMWIGRIRVSYRSGFVGVRTKEQEIIAFIDCEEVRDEANL